MREAIAILTERKISELPVLGSRHEPVGVIDITDVVAFLPAPPNFADTQPRDECEDEPLIIPSPNRSPENRVHET